MLRYVSVFLLFVMLCVPTAISQQREVTVHIQLLDVEGQPISGDVVVVAEQLIGPDQESVRSGHQERSVDDPKLHWPNAEGEVELPITVWGEVQQRLGVVIYPVFKDIDNVVGTEKSFVDDLKLKADFYQEHWFPWPYVVLPIPADTDLMEVKLQAQPSAELKPIGRRPDGTLIEEVYADCRVCPPILLLPEESQPSTGGRSVDLLGDQLRTVVSVSGENSLVDTFAVVDGSAARDGVLEFEVTVPACDPDAKVNMHLTASGGTEPLPVSVVLISMDGSHKYSWDIEWENGAAKAKEWEPYDLQQLPVCTGEYIVTLGYQVSWNDPSSQREIPNNYAWGIMAEIALINNANSVMNTPEVDRAIEQLDTILVMRGETTEIKLDVTQPNPKRRAFLEAWNEAYHSPAFRTEQRLQ